MAVRVSRMGDEVSGQNFVDDDQKSSQINWAPCSVRLHTISIPFSHRMRDMKALSRRYLSFKMFYEL